MAMVSFSVRGVAKRRQKSMKGQSQPCWPGLYDLQDICQGNFDFLGQGLVSQVKRYSGQKGSTGGGLDKRPLGGVW